jgi:DNA repair photolyase
MEMIDARSIFSAATGFVARGGFDWTCNPYLGCVFGCSYCYAMFTPQNRRPREEWGRWFVAKRNAVELAHRTARRLSGKALYMSSVTDPYQPVERSLMLTRGILEALVPVQPRLLIQTRGPLVVRDIDLLKRFRHVRVNVSIPTDSERIRETFEPKAPKLENRWQALAEVRAEGISVGICVTPMLPIEDAEGFARRVKSAAPDVLVVQDFHESVGCFGADTGAEARRLLAETNWTDHRFREVVEQLTRTGLTVYEAEKGFFPP